MGLTDIADSTERLKLMTLEYYTERDGNFIPEPIMVLFCRDSSGERRMVEVEDFYGYFYITEDEFFEHKKDILNDSMVRAVEVDASKLDKETALNGSVYPTSGAPKATLDGTRLAKIFTVEPHHVRKMSEFFDKTWEADVFFKNRFLIDSGISQGIEIPAGADRISYEELTVLEPGDEPDIKPRMHTVDIEVWTGGIFPEPLEAPNPVTAITAHDSYTDEYFCGVLDPEASPIDAESSWPDEPAWESPDGVDDVDVTIYDDENQMLADYISFVNETDPDLMTGWNSSRNEISSGFDYPYIITRSEKMNEWTYRSMAYDDDSVYVTKRGAPAIKGREMFDMLQAYKKTQIHEKRSYALGYIAEDELGYGKEDVEDGLDEGWLHHPVQFIKYNIRDVQAVHEIEASKSVIDMYDHIRTIAGATYSEIADSNIGIIDMLFLREAGIRGIALPTSERPDVQHYWGAYVFPPVAGKHRNVVYPDLSSLYPNLFRDMNASPETIVGFEDDLEASEYSKDDCHVVYVDTRDENVKRSADSPERTPLYVLKPETKESFVREIIQQLIDMKYEYKSDEYPAEAYEAVKRITNSVYGVMGDSVSYGKGFRLFDWRIAEAITLAGREVIQHTAKEFEQCVQEFGYEDAAIIAGDTDSCVCEIPSAEDMDETIDVALKAAEYVDGTYDNLMNDRYNMDENNMAVEVESYAESALFMDKKKRYAQWVRWDEGDVVDEVEVKGFELVRSDSAEITAEIQMGVIERILKEEKPADAVAEYIHEQWHEIIDKKIDLTRLGVPSAINNPLMSYGWSKDDTTGEPRFYTPQPHIRGARYANLYIEGEDLEQGSKPLMFYVKAVSPAADIPEVYDYQDMFDLTAKVPADEENKGFHEVGRKVDAISVEDVNNIPPTIRIDYKKMAEKNMRKPVEPIMEVMNWNFDWFIEEGTQVGLADFM